MAKRKPANIFEKSTYKLWLFIIFVVLVCIYLLFIHGDYGLYKYWKLEKEKQSLQLKIKQLRLERTALQEEIELLKSNKQYIEKVAREKFKMGRPKEKVYYISSDSQSQKQP